MYFGSIYDMNDMDIVVPTLNPVIKRKRLESYLYKWGMKYENIYRCN